MNKTELRKMTSETLLATLANCAATYYGCSGHNKAHWNSVRMAECREELVRRKLAQPSVEDLLTVGVFNGTGAY
jgi:hypothetical protein